VSETTDDTLIEDDLPVADTRPAMALGLPIEILVPIGMAGAAATLFFDGFISLVYGGGTFGGLWSIAFAACRNDYNAPRCWVLWLDSTFKHLDKALWGGASPAPAPLRLPARFRGIADA
jgi:type IV secretion system protein VirB3